MPKKRQAAHFAIQKIFSCNEHLDFVSTVFCHPIKPKNVIIFLVPEPLHVPLRKGTFSFTSTSCSPPNKPHKVCASLLPTTMPPQRNE